MSHPKEDLRATGESIRRDAERVDDLERQKAELDPADPRIDVLSRQVEEVVSGMHDKAAAETELAEEIAPAG